VPAGEPVYSTDVVALVPNIGVYSLFRSTTLDITTTTYADYTGASFPFTKRLAATALLVTIGGSGYANLTAAAYSTTYGINVNSVDYDVKRFYWQALSTHYGFAGQARVAAALAAGTYTIQLRAKNAVASRTTRHDSSDDISFSVQEIP
jgi:hypothetical protein